MQFSLATLIAKHFNFAAPSKDLLAMDKL